MKSDELYALLRRRGVLWPSAEIYGGAQGLYDYGPLGFALKQRIESAWTSWFVGLSPDYYRIEPAEIVPEPVVRASGHLEYFTDPEVQCENCHSVFRADTLLEKVRPEGVDGLALSAIGEILRENRVKCPSCGNAALSVPRPFNMMFGFGWGVTEKERAYLRPETAQSSYLSFARMWDVGRRALPLGIAIVGKAYRNEIAPRQVLFRMRAFTQAELQIFFDPGEPPLLDPAVESEVLPVVRVGDRKLDAPVPTSGTDLVASGIPPFYVHHLVHTFRFARDVLGVPADRIRFWEKSDEERMFYNRIQFDLEVRVESLGGYKEIGAVHYRGDYDLTKHAAGSGKELAVRPEGREKVTPHVLELTWGVDRTLWALADLQIDPTGEWTVWRLPAYLAPVPVAVFPLLKKEHRAAALDVARRLQAEGFEADYDESGGIGRRYARMDEAGTPYCITIDGETVATEGAGAGTVTLRERDSKKQERVAVDRLGDRLRGSFQFPRPSR